MRVAFNAYFFKYPASGIGQYLLQLASALVEIDQQNNYILLSPGISTPADFHYPHLHTIYRTPAWTKQNSNIQQMLWEQWFSPTAARQTKADILHVPYFAAPLFLQQPTIVTIPDTIHFRVPHYLEGLSKKLYMQMNKQGARQLHTLITFSQHAKQDIIDLLGIPAERIHVIYLAAAEGYHPIQDPEELARVRARYGIGERYIFYLGGLDRRKNVLQLIRAFARLITRISDPSLQLFIAGDPDAYPGSSKLFPDPRPLIKETGIADRVRFQVVQEEDKAALYSGTALFVYPSLYEGFGLPPLEAMKCGAPVICTHRTSLPEVVGSAALPFDPEQTETLVSAMYNVLTNPQLRAELCMRSLQRASLFQWRKTAEQTITVYEKVMMYQAKCHQ